MMTSSQIRQSFLDFFRSKQHTIVPSSSLMPDSPGLLFTNAGMNQFVPIFHNQKKPDVSKWAGAVPGLDTRAADTQKCIRAGGKHNDLEDVGLDSYHHTFFEMLGNWSFGDYFKKEAIEWAWELLTEVWGFPGERLYATVYKPGKGEPAEFDQEASDHWARLFNAAGLDPKVHICTGGKRDNFWMMGDTGPCGPCSEIHMDLTPAGDTRGALVNKSDARCIEVWNLVFIQFNADPDGTYSSLPARHVDTGMGFERVAAIIQGTNELKDFANARISNYETDVFRPIFDELEKLSGRKFGSTLPKPGSAGETEQEKIDVAFRVIADHIRTLSFAIADGVQPGNTDRNYVLRRILRRAVRYGRTLRFHEPFFYKLVDVLALTMGDVFPEIRARQTHVRDAIGAEEEAFNKTLDRGIELFEQGVKELRNLFPPVVPGMVHGESAAGKGGILSDGSVRVQEFGSRDVKGKLHIDGSFAFKLFDTYGFPLDLTELMARERGLTVDVEGFSRLMEEQKARARAAQKKSIISVSEVGGVQTEFVGYDRLEADCEAKISQGPEGLLAMVNVCPLYAEMGGQVGDTGELMIEGSEAPHRVLNTVKRGQAHFLILQETDAGSRSPVGQNLRARLKVDANRRAAIQRHHTVTHLFHWALHEVVSRDATQKGSHVGPEKLTFDFNSTPLTPRHIADIEKLVNERIVENTGVSWTEVPYADVRNRKDILQFFGDKYGDVVRVVQMGGEAGKLDGYSMELCGGTHTRATGEIGLFRIVSESAVAAGVRRVEAIAGLVAYQQANRELELIKSIADKVNSPVGELERRIEALMAQQKQIEKQLEAATRKEAVQTAKSLLGQAIEIPTANTGSPLRAIIANVGVADGETLQAIADALKAGFKGVIVLGGVANEAVSLVAAVSPESTKRVQAGKIIQTIAPIVGGKGGGRPDNARGGGRDAGRLDEALAKAKQLLQ